MTSPKVLVVGAGHWGQNLVRTFYQLGALAGVAEVSPELRNRIAQEYPSIPVYDDYREILGRQEVGVVIATPAHTHMAIARESLVAGHDVYVEKPFTLSARDAEELVELAAERSQILMVGHLLLYQPAIRMLKDMISEGRIGKLCSLHQERSKLGRVRRVESVLWSFGVHDVAVLLHLVGQAPIRIRAVGQRVLQPAIEDNVFLHLDFQGGVQAHLHVSWLWPAVRRRLTVVGTHGMLVYDERSQTVTLHQKYVDDNLIHHDDGEHVVFQGHEEPLRIECQHFLDCVSSRQAPLTDGRSAVEVIRVLEQADRQLEQE
ncbi:MAG: Gfo/Idh/MocA family oxidoreductase [Alicyclobacillus sp.]|nr:Gfo/Idh/MocA family oxidoreductase [Alicyclobacillus sp.]